MAEPQSRKMDWVISRYLVIGLCFVSFWKCLRAETVTLLLRNGDRLTGEMVSMDSRYVTITNNLIGKIAVPVGQVEKMEKQSVAKTEAKPAPASPPPVAPSTTTNQPAAAPAVAQPAPAPAPPPATPKGAESAAAKPADSKPATPPPVAAQPKPKPPKRWVLDAQIGLDLQYNQHERQLYYGRAKWTYGKGRFRSIVDYIANYGQTDGVLTANDMNGSVKLERDVTKKLFAFDAAGAGYNEIRKIDFSCDDSFGVGYKVLNKTDFLLKKDNFAFNTDLGGNYQQQFLSDGTDRDYFSLRLGETAAWKINTKLSFDEKLEYYPRFTGFDDYRVRFEANLRYLLMPNLTLNLTAIDLYDTLPAPGVTNNDFLLRASLGIKF
jgi:hypothetical protein